MHDITPKQSQLWQYLERVCLSLTRQYGYQEIRSPILESTHLFKRTIGDATDIVEKEMYCFTDRNGDLVSLRPEGTASCVRAGIQNGLLYNQIQRLWYQGPMYRRENPQKGRYRQFHQWGVEAFGIQSFGIDVELISMTHRLWQLLGLDAHLHLEINTLGTVSERQAYREKLVAFLQDHHDDLDPDSQRRMHSNPLRVLDSKVKQTQAILEQAPKLWDSLSDESRSGFEWILKQLKALNIPYHVNPKLVRGLDYYQHTVFEWVTDALGAQGTVCAGGRYDGLVALLGGQSTPAAGFAMGMDRVILLLEEAQAINPLPQADIYLIATSCEYAPRLYATAEALRSSLSTLAIVVDHNHTALKSQLKRADKSQAQFAVIIGESEWDMQKVMLKPLRGTGEQQVLTLSECIEFLSQHKGVAYAG